MVIKKSNSGGWRVNILTILILIAAGGILYRLFNLTLIRHADFVRSARIQYSNPTSQLKERGKIYFSGRSDIGLAAVNRPFKYIFSNNNQIESKSENAELLAEILGVGNDEILNMISNSGKDYVVIKEGISEKEAEKIKSLNLKGINIASGIKRIYPDGSLASSVLGFVGFEGLNRVGQYGVEASYDAILSGEEKTQSWLGNYTYLKVADLLKSLVADSKESIEEAGNQERNGDDIVLTIDKDIQIFAESKLEETLGRWQSPSGLIIIQNPQDGSILALASSPGFDPNNYAEFDLGSFVNPATQKLFEPGSSFKPITMAGAINKGAVSPDTTYEDGGAVAEGGFVIKNFDEKAHGVQTMRQVLEKSLNTGAIFAQQKLGNDDFLNHVVAFGFGQKSGIDLPGEINGNISNLYSGRKINFMTASFGQGIAATPIQLINAYSAIANGGRLMQPYVLKEIVRADGSRIKTEPTILGQPVSEKTALQLKSMLTDVVDNGFDKARIAGYDVAGKTGTAQISEGGEYSDELIHSFVGFAPSYNPKFVILIKMDRPKGEEFAANTLSPVFSDVARFLLNYFDVPPTRR